MSDRVTVNLDILEKAFPMLMEHLKQAVGNEVNLDVDYYWSVRAPEAHDMTEMPAELSVGQVSECMEWLTALTENPEHALTYHLVWFADVLRVLGQTVAK